MHQELYQQIPSSNTLLESSLLSEAIAHYGREVVLFSIRKELSLVRQEIVEGRTPNLSIKTLSTSIVNHIENIYKPTMKAVINGTGTVIHTNLGRSPLGQSVLEDLAHIIGYTNIEFDLEKGRRGHRSVHAKEALTYITGAEDVAVVNNNAAAVLLLLQTFAQGKEVILSRGEMIEVGGSFRIPDIMSASGAKLVEVGCTNKTRLSDYEKAITEDTAVIFKVHHSNFAMTGFVEEASLEELVQLCKAKNILLIYDLGSGLLRKPNLLKEITEHDVATAVSLGVDLVSFSTDKLMGGPQGGVIVGKKELVEKCNKHPLMRSLRVGKLTYSALSTVCREYLSDETLFKNNPLFTALSQNFEEIEQRAQELAETINQNYAIATVVASNAQVGGGTLPHVKLSSMSVKIDAHLSSTKKREVFAEKLFKQLLTQPMPIVSVLKEGFVHIDLFTITSAQVPRVAEAIITLVSPVLQSQKTNEGALL